MIKEINPTKKCPECGSKFLRKLYSEKTGEFVGYQCERCNHWWEPKEDYETGLYPTSMVVPFG